MLFRLIMNSLNTLFKVKLVKRSCRNYNAAVDIVGNVDAPTATFYLRHPLLVNSRDIQTKLTNFLCVFSRSPICILNLRFLKMSIFYLSLVIEQINFGVLKTHLHLN